MLGWSWGSAGTNDPLRAGRFQGHQDQGFGAPLGPPGSMGALTYHLPVSAGTDDPPRRGGSMEQGIDRRSALSGEVFLSVVVSRLT